MSQLSLFDMFPQPDPVPEPTANLAHALEKVKLSYKRVLDTDFYQIPARLQAGTGNFAEVSKPRRALRI